MSVTTYILVAIFSIAGVYAVLGLFAAMIYCGQFAIVAITRGGMRFCEHRRIRSGPGYCRGCGYDLRGNLSGICPECGRATTLR